MKPIEFLQSRSCYECDKELGWYSGDEYQKTICSDCYTKIIKEQYKNVRSRMRGLGFKLEEIDKELDIEIENELQ